MIRSLPEVRSDLERALEDAEAFIQGGGSVLDAYARAYGLLVARVSIAVDDIDEVLEPPEFELEDRPEFEFPERVVS